MERNDFEIKFLNESISIDETIALKSFLIKFIQSWENFFSGFKLHHSVQSALDRVKNFEKSINITDDFQSVATNLNSLLYNDRWPTISVIETRINSSDQLTVSSYLYGAIKGGPYVKIQNENINYSFYLLGVLDYDAFKENFSYSDKLLSNIRNNEAETFRKLNNIIDIEKEVMTSANVYNDLLNSIKSVAENNIKKYYEDLDNIKNEFQEKLNFAVANAKEIASQQLKLQKSYAYWKMKFKVHSFKERNSFFNLLILCGILLIAVPLTIYFIHDKIPSDTGKFIDPLSICIGVILALSFWGVRILSRVWLSHEHLKNDAHEKMVMTQTYLALSLENGIDDSQKSIFLSSVFKPVQDGIVKDDGPSTPLVELLNSIKKISK